MMRENCPQEEAVSEAARSGHWEESVSRHAAECPYCREIVQTSSWMQAMAQGGAGDAALPDASLLWWRAQLSERRAKLERAQKAIEWLQIASNVLACVGLVGWTVWNWRAVFGAVAGYRVTFGREFG